MIRSGTVIKEEPHGVLVRFAKLAACAGCAACGRDQKVTTIFVHGEARMGDIVSVQMPDAQILRASLLTYLVPLAGFVGGLLLGNALAKTDAAMVLGGLLGLTMAGVFLWLVDKRLGRQTKWQAHILSVNDPDVIAEMEKEETCPKAASWSA